MREAHVLALCAPARVEILLAVLAGPRLEDADRLASDAEELAPYLSSLLARTPTRKRTQAERQMLRELARGERETHAGGGFSLKRVVADADGILARARKRS